MIIIYIVLQNWKIQMANVLIACNNADSVDLHNFLQSCADLARQQCVDFNHNYSFVEPPHLTEQEVISPMPYHQICLIAAHGDADGVYNENHEDVVTTRTINYNFEGKGFYSVSCLCAQNLRIELICLSLSFFIRSKICSSLTMIFYFNVF